MSKLENICLETINEIKKFLENRVEYTTINEYINKQEKKIQDCQNLSKNESAEYVDKLVTTLDE